MGSIIRLHDDEHRELQELLPWYVTGQLEPGEHARVGAHVETCPECQAEVRFQQRLQAEIAQLPLEVEEGWVQMKRRLEAEGRARPAAAIRRASRVSQRWLGWGIAAALTVVVGVSAIPKAQLETGTYQALGAKPAAAPGNLVVIFRPDTTEKAIREMLNASQIRIVDGPTAADAYVLRAPANTRDAVVATLQANRNVVLAQPIDP
jgi:predicted anti-sigma-YlaC factor YlaD